MKKIRVFLSLFFLIIMVLPIPAQIYSKPDPSAQFKRSKGIIVLIPTIKGSFFLNNSLLAELNVSDTIYIININPGRYTAKVVSGNLALENKFILNMGNVLEINVTKDEFLIRKNPLAFEDVAEKVQGKTRYFIRRLSYFNITQASLHTWNYKGIDPDQKGSWFNTFTTINGFQVVPGFCAGLGITYSNHNVDPDSYGYYFSPVQNVSFLPVYLDIRTHLSSRQVAPFIKFDIGYNILLTHKSISMQYTYYSYQPVTQTTEFKLTGGGVYISPGIGLRIAVNKLIQVLVSFEYVYERATALQTWPGHPDNKPDYPMDQKMMSFKINIGIGFQK